MRRIVIASLLATVLASGPLHADPAIDVRYEDGRLRVTLAGSYQGHLYQVWRAGEFAGTYDPLSTDYTLCTGDCFLTDLEAAPGRTYFYRFDLFPPGGALVSYGPYAVTVPDTPVRARVWPNPSRGAARLELSVPGGRGDAPVPARATLLDLQGRTLATLFEGSLARGTTPISWDGRSRNGQPLRAGLYFVRLATPLGTTTTRLARVE